MYILGLSSMVHDAAAALLNERGVVAAIEEGKLARSRSAAGIPRLAIQHCLDRAGIDWRSVDQIAIASRPAVAWRRQTLFRTRLAPLSPLSSGYFLNKAFGELGRELNNFRIVRALADGPEGRVAGYDHHLCHAASAYFASGFERALIVTLDERGDGRAGFAGIGENLQIRELASVHLPHSLAWAYTQFTTLLGFRPHADEHKTQWLSLAGEPIFADFFLSILRRHPPGPPRLNGRYFQNEFAGQISFTEKFYARLGTSRDSEAMLGDPLRANIASSVQRACATVVWDWLESLRNRTAERNLCLAGGLFLNPLLVSAIEKNTGFERIFVQPATGNEGTSLGAAWLAWHKTPGAARFERMTNVYAGPSYPNEAIKQVLDNCKDVYRWCDSEDRKIEEAVRLLEAGKIVAWYQGAAEFGPRALGNRSLLASPWAPYVKENLNDYVKHRESFRPFALSMPAEHCARYFECSANGRFMTTMATANEEGRKLLGGLPAGFLLPGNLVRLHVVDAEDNPLLWKLLKRSGENAPAPILINTSFNLFGEPLVVSPRDAVRSYYCSGTDALIAGSFLLTKH
ncbi:MAG: carbamoyltransferase family protein [Candidatus Acidiferrales bacterium]